MNKIIILVLSFLCISSAAFADDRQSAMNFFNNYVKAANSYDMNLGRFYSPKAVIIRQVVKPDGSTANAYTDTNTYVKQMKLSASTAKIRKYTNTYRNINIVPYNGGYKISAERQPKGEKYWLKIYQVLKKQPNGSWIITEEMMQTKEQIFLLYVKGNK